MAETAHTRKGAPGQRVRLANVLQELDEGVRALEASLATRLDADAERREGDQATILALQLQLTEERRLRMEAARQLDRAARTLQKLCNG